MGRRYTVSRDYAVSAEMVWADVIDFKALAESMKGRATYEGLPEGDARVGEAFTVTVRRRWSPPMRWTMKVVERDDAAMVLRSEEHGGPVRLYTHRLSVAATGPQSCRCIDELDVDAGLLTPLIAPTFRAMYEQRHVARKARLEGGHQ
ncbi:MAG: SRPBCC family protein [Pseudomonadota bacterium]